MVALLAGGALALIALGGALVAYKRRRKRAAAEVRHAMSASLRLQCSCRAQPPACAVAASPPAPAPFTPPPKRVPL
jgi:hypothetical protein